MCEINDHLFGRGLVGQQSVIEKQKQEFGSCIFDPPGHGRIGGHYFHTWYPSVRPYKKQKRATTDTMRENNDHCTYWLRSGGSS